MWLTFLTAVSHVAGIETAAMLLRKRYYQLNGHINHYSQALPLLLANEHLDSIPQLQKYRPSTEGRSPAQIWPQVQQITLLETICMRNKLIHVYSGVNA